MQRFTRQTIINPLMKIRQERLLPSGGEVVTRPGQEVSPGHVVARTPQKMDFHILPLTDLLRLSHADLEKHLLVKEGAVLKMGTTLVSKRGLFSKAYVSPVEGVLYRVRNGRLVIQRTSDVVQLRALVHGRVINQIPDRGVIIETNGSLIQATWSSGKERFGPLKMLAIRANEPLTAYQLTEETDGHVLVVGQLNDLEALEKCVENNVRGLITGSITADLCQAASALPFSVIATDGIGNQGMAQPIFHLLQESDGREASLFGRIHEHSGNRPEIIIASSATPKTDTPPAHEPIAAGQKVRILRPPYSSQVGEIVRLYNHMQTTPIGTKAHGAGVRLEDGHIVFIPYVNLDIIV